MFVKIAIGVGIILFGMYVWLFRKFMIAFETSDKNGEYDNAFFYAILSFALLLGFGLYITCFLDYIFRSVM